MRIASKIKWLFTAMIIYLFLKSIPAVHSQNNDEFKQVIDYAITAKDSADMVISASGDQFYASNQGSDQSIILQWTVSQPILLGGWVYSHVYVDDVEITEWATKEYMSYGFKKTYTKFWETEPYTAHRLKVVRIATDLFGGNRKEYVMRRDRRTEPLRAPYSVGAHVWVDSIAKDPWNQQVTLFNPSDKFINITWYKGSYQPDSLLTYLIYKNGAFYHEHTLPYNFIVTGNTTPDTEDEWAVQASYKNGQHRSVRVRSRARTSPLRAPEKFIASKDTTNDFIRLSWDNKSHWATQINIYREGVHIDSVDAFEHEEYFDYAIKPGKEYNYYLTAYVDNELITIESEPTDVQQGRTAFIKATDGEIVGGKNAVNLTWSWIHRDSVDIIRLDRDGFEFHVVPGQKFMLDEDGEPGRLYKYTLYIRLKNGKEITASDYGFRIANGRVDGQIKTRSGGPVKDIDVRAQVTPAPLSSSLQLDGIDDHVELPYIARGDEMTISAWIKTSATAYQRIIGWSHTAPPGFKYHGNLIFFSTTEAGKLQYGISDGFPYTGDPKFATSSSNVNTGKWVFVSAVYNNGTVQLYVNGVPDGRSRNVGQQVTTNTLAIGADLSDASTADVEDPFNGWIDEVQIWDIARTTLEVQQDMHHVLRGNEPGLVGYWPFKLGTGSVAGDYATSGNHHGEMRGGAGFSADIPEIGHYGITNSAGRYAIENIYWATGADIEIIPFKEKHGFDPVKQPLTLNPQKHFWESINFTDTTSISVSGQVNFASTPACGMEGVEIILNNKSTGVFTDSSGHFDIIVEEPGNYKIAPAFKDHIFVPADTTFLIESTVTSLLFTDTTTAVLSGKMRAGCDYILGAAKLLIKGLHSDCFSTIKLTNEDGEYAVPLPAQEYTVQLIDIDHPDRVDIINYFIPDTVDLTEQDSTLNIIYHEPPTIKISGFPLNGCGDFDVPIAEQEVTYPLKIEVIESYGNSSCPVETGSITIKDRVGHNIPDTTLTIGDEEILYYMIPGYPRLDGSGIHPHQKMFIVDAKVGNRLVSDTTWIFVQGQKPREFQFSTVSPEIPLMILRDPPGDQSYSYLSKENTSNVLLGLSFETDAGIGVFSETKAGGGFDIPGIGKGGAWVGAKAEASIGVRSVIEGTYEMEISTTETLKTSDSDKITGSSGDLFMGAAINIMYAKTDVLEYDSETCSVVRDTSIVWHGNGFETTYLYTDSHIRGSVIPNLIATAAILKTSPLLVDRDRAIVLEDQAYVWQQVLAYNDGLKQSAQPLPPINGQPQFPGNISFSAGSNLTEEATMTSTMGASFEFYLYIAAEVAVSAGAKQGDWNEFSGGFKIFSKLEIGAKAKVSYKTSNTIGFELADDDADGPGDAFTVDILGDPVYGTPVFRLVGGTSSCPWEHPTLPREGVGLSMDTYIKKDIPAGQFAHFDLYLTNESQSEETRTYFLSTIHTSNPDGATITVNDVKPDKMEFTMPYNISSPQRATLRVGRVEGSAYDYENLQVHLYSPCDGQIDTVITFSAHFEKPCTEVAISNPANNWIVNNAHPDTLVIVLQDYDKSYPTLEQIMFEYQLRGSDNWVELFNRPRATVLHDTIQYFWDIAAMDENDYELRASTHSPTGSYYSRRAIGKIDRTAPSIFGSKQPADQVLDIGDEISAIFDENLDKNSVTLQNVLLLKLGDSTLVNIEVKSFNNKITIVPTSSALMEDNAVYQATITAIADLQGNIIPHPVSWQFVCNMGQGTAVDDAFEMIPTQFALEQNYPNPFNPTTLIRYAIPEAAHVTLALYNMRGQKIQRLAEGQHNPGFYTVSVDGSRLGSGVYFYRIQAGQFLKMRKMLLVK
ncbi:MAG: T9SS C-terminal target domain-containing protein [Calditrichaeota bacterium]|nr:MAG: T9SS C-terminal target domain-containing protein [Calditrichota bacterium]